MVNGEIISKNKEQKGANMELDRLDYVILTLLKNNNYTSYFRSMTIQEIMSVTNTTRPTTYRRVMRLFQNGYVKKGCKSVQADTFYLSNEGIELIDVRGGMTND